MVEHRPDNRSLGQFFFELGYGACWADAFMANPNLPQHFSLSDSAVERAWDVLPLCQDTSEDCVEFDRRKALANAAPELLEALKLALEYPASASTIWGEKARAAISKATGSPQ